ncbi:MAG: aldo/keto reductase [Bryobacteraceae bacterium]
MSMNTTGANPSGGPVRRTFLKMCGAAVAAQAATRDQRVRFGQTDLYVSRLCQGTAFRKVTREANDSAGQAILHRCLDLGINFFDSSNAYGWGGAEMALGKAIAGRRDQVVIATKVSPSLKPEGNTPSGKTRLSRDFVFTQVEGSLRRLKTDHIDLYLYHSPDNETRSEELAETMDSLVRAGKIRYWGASNFSPPQIGEFIELAKRKGKAPIAGLEDYYNIIAGTRRDFMENELFPLIRRGRLGLMAFSPLAEGRLAPDRPVDPGKPWAHVVAALDSVARELGATRPQVCIAWMLAHNEVTSVLAGAEEPRHVEDNLRGTQLVLSPSALKTLNAASDRLRGIDTSGR